MNSVLLNCHLLESWGLESKTNNLYVMRLSQRILQHLRQGSAPNVTWWDIFIVSTDVESSPATNCKQRGVAKLSGENGEFRGFWVLEGFKTLESLLQSAFRVCWYSLIHDGGGVFPPNFVWSSTFWWHPQDVKIPFKTILKLQTATKTGLFPCDGGLWRKCRQKSCFMPRGKLFVVETIRVIWPCLEV